MTDDRSAKKAARARMAATGEPYSTARRAVQTAPDRPAPLARPPAIDPREHALHCRHWGVLACYLVRYEGRYSAWIMGADPGDRSEVYGMPSEPAGRAFVDVWQAMNLLHTPWGERIATIFMLSPSTRNGILYEAAVVNVEDSGIWLACFDDTANDGGTHALGQSEHLDDALEEFAALMERAADRLGSTQAIDKPALSPASSATGRQRRVPTPRGPRWAMPFAATSPVPTAAAACARSGTRPAWEKSPWAACWPARTGPGLSSRSTVLPARGSRTHPPPPSPPAPSTATAST